MIFMGNGRAKQRQDAIAERLGDVALIAMDGLHHELQRGINNGPGVLRVEPFDERGRAFEVSEESSDGLALTLGDTTRLHRRLLGEDMLGSMTRRVGDGGLGTGN